MTKEKVLVIGASGQIGVELTLALRKIYGNSNVVASDLREENELLKGSGPYVSLDVMNKEMLHVQVIRQNITQIYLLAAILSATGEKNPNLAWHLNMQGLLNVLDIAREEKMHKVYWPSSIAVFGPTSPKKDCPQRTIIEPSTVYGISKYAGEFWCNYYHQRYGVDVRSLRYPGLISYKSEPGGGTTDYAVEIYHRALEDRKYTCFLSEDTYLPMMYMPDAIRATALRELHEEAGYGLGAGGEVISLGHFFPSAGFTDEHSHLLLVRPAVPIDGGARPESAEAITECRAFSVEELKAMIASGEVRDANTLAAFARMVAMGLI